MVNKLKDYLFLHGILFIYAICALCEKFTSTLPFMSFNFCLFYVIVVGFLGVYALLWQQVLKKIDLNVAFANKAVTVIWGIILGYLVFGDSINFSMIIGGILVILGIIMVVRE